MGIYVPAMGIRFNHEQQYLGPAGPVSVAAQSGTHALNISALLHANGVDVNKVVSFGNGVILESPDFLEYYKNDPTTEMIVMYIEGVKDGRRLVRLLKETSKMKPVIIFKGGQTEAGTRATRSHTSSLAEPMHIWDAIFKQTGAVRADSLEEITDIAQALRFTKPSTGQRMALISMTGGQSVITTDAFARAGLEVPVLTDKSYEELAAFFNVTGGSFRNPIDMGGNWGSEESIFKVLQILNDDPNIDAMSVEFSVNFLTGRFQKNPEFYQRFMNALNDYKKQFPLVVVLPPSHMESELIEGRHRFQSQGFAAFQSFGRAAVAYKRTSDYHRWREANS
jgi:acyl-CoA synthetase (NDP forming)